MAAPWSFYRSMPVLLTVEIKLCTFVINFMPTVLSEMGIVFCTCMCACVYPQKNEKKLFFLIGN